ncbi:hypothetical protein [Dysgonomonas massiliensis]|uniref:hypothetical protein n=1 Tax=Dysgonomonas massiliensis TaxID=2040292 RepID=UPI000C775F1A|nr:hypothetical protein [Dysgonomonas massiliensis]
MQVAEACFKPDYAYLLRHEYDRMLVDRKDDTFLLKNWKEIILMIDTKKSDINIVKDGVARYADFNKQAAIRKMEELGIIDKLKS